MIDWYFFRIIGVKDVSRSLGPGIRNLGMMCTMRFVPGSDEKRSFSEVLLRMFQVLQQASVPEKLVQDMLRILRTAL